MFKFFKSIKANKAAKAAEAASSARAADGKRILVVDDNPVDRQALSLMLTAKGHQVLLAESGEDAISLINTEKPDLILLDMDIQAHSSTIGGVFRDGLMVIDWVDRINPANQIPVFIVSSLSPEQYEKRARDNGITTFFRKPVDKEKLHEAITQTFSKPPTEQPA